MRFLVRSQGVRDVQEHNFHFPAFDTFPTKRRACLILVLGLRQASQHRFCLGLVNCHRTQAVSLSPRLDGSHWNDLRALARSVAQVDLRDVSACDGTQGHFVHATRQGNCFNEPLVRQHVCEVLEDLKCSPCIIEIDEAYVLERDEQARPEEAQCGSRNGW